MRLLHRPLLMFVLSVVAHPIRVLVVSATILVVCVALAVWKLDISTDQNKLFNPRVPFFRDYLSFVERFPENEAIYVVIEPRHPGEMPPVGRWTALADALAARLRPMGEYVVSVDQKVPINQLGDMGLLFDEPARVEQSLAQVRQFVPLVKLWGEKPSLLERALGGTPVERFVTALRAREPVEQVRPLLDLVARSMTQTLQTGQMALPDLATLGATDPSRLGYYYVPDSANPARRIMLVRIYPRKDFTSLTAISRTVEAIRDATRAVARDYPEFAVGITGRPVLEADEMRTTDRDTRRAEILALAAVFVGLVVMLRSVWLAAAGQIALGVGIGWTFGWATVSVGELNLLSIVFLLALIGIGMDYLVQILTRYRQEFRRRARPKTIWAAVFTHVAAPINTACVGAAGAFLVSIFTDFRGAAELGIIAGGGLLLCLLAGYVVLPALLTLFPPNISRADGFRHHLGPVAPGGRRRFITPCIWIALLLIGVPLMLRTGFDPNLLNLQAQNLESVRLVRRLQTWSVVVLTTDLETLRLARDAVSDAPTVAQTESILRAHENLEMLRARRGQLPAIQWTAPAAVQAGDIAALAEKLAALSRHMGGMPSLDALAQQVRETPAETAALRLSAWQAGFVDRLRSMLSQFSPRGLDVNRLPPELRNHFVGSDGSIALHIYPRADLWKQSELNVFLRDVEPRIREALAGRQYTLTGIAHNIYNSTAAIERSFYRATLYAIVLILILVFIDLRKVGQTLAAVSVLALGLPMLVAMMGLFGRNWNFANFFALPILIGAGHEYGVFLVHRYREALHDPRRVWRRWDVADKALLMCAYVTTTAFGFFALLASHRGLQSLGWVMAVGTMCIYLAGIFVLRPLLIWDLRRRSHPGKHPGRPLHAKIGDDE